MPRYIYCSLILSLVFSACAPVFTGATADIAGYHTTWPEKGLFLTKDVAKGIKISAADVQERPVAAAVAGVDQLCFAEEAIGATSRHNLKAGQPLYFHNLQDAKFKQVEDGRDRPSAHVYINSREGVRLLVSNRELRKDEIIDVDQLSDVIVPENEAPLDMVHSRDEIVGLTSVGIPAGRLVCWQDIQIPEAKKKQ
ncbi:MAG: hypothetical protein K2W82_05965 [Candidatus Obscuribacterales bacterium]|nr:hypothetical protein [Candidatus Obscuribacterales bacterium]